MKKLLLPLFTLLATAGFSAAAEDTVLLEADFSVLTEGSETAPVEIKASDLNAKVPAVYKSNYGGTSKVYQAGGSLLIEDGGKLEFNGMSGVTRNSVVRITAEVKMGNDFGGMLVFANSSYASAKTQSLEVYGDDWQTVIVYSGNFTSSTYRLNLYPSLSVGGVFVKSLKVETSPDMIAPTTAYLPNDNTDGTSFTARWATCTNCSGYELDVYSYNNGEKEYAIQAQEINSQYTTSQKVTGLDPAKQYYYVIRVKNSAGKLSVNSNEVEVIRCITSLDAPEALAATNVSDKGFTANWAAVENAKGYSVNVYSSKKLTAESEVAVFEEDFSGVNIGTVEQIEYTGDLNSFTKETGWLAQLSSKAYAQGYFVLFPYDGPGVVATPVIDLSNNGGAFSVTVNAAVGTFGSYYATQNTLKVDLVEGDDLDDMTVIEEGEAKVLSTKEYTDYTFNFTKGSANSRIRLTYTQSGNQYKLYIDGIKVNQTLAAGSVVKNRIATKAVDDVTSADIEVALSEDLEYSYNVIAIGETVVGSGSSAEIGEIISDPSKEISFVLSGIDNITADSDAPAAWKAGEGVLGVNGSDIAVYDIAGRMLYHNTLPAGVHTLNINVRGLVIVKVDGKACKIVL